MCKQFFLFIISIYLFKAVHAQNKYVLLNGDNSITLENEAFNSTTEWQSLSTYFPHVGMDPIQTTWFVHNGQSHIVIQLTNNQDDRLLLELSRNKKLYQFPKDLHSDDNDYHFNQFELYVKDKQGVSRKFDFGKKANINVQVNEITPTHIQISFSGTICYHPHPSSWDYGPLSDPMSISGKIALSKKDPVLPQLKDNYSGCDNTVYNEVSPYWKTLGNWRSATECEKEFYAKIFPLMKKALQPVYDYYKSKAWNFDHESLTTYSPLDIRLKAPADSFFHNQDATEHRDYFMYAVADINSKPYADLNKKMMEILSNPNNKNAQKELASVGAEQSEFSFKITIFLNRNLDETDKGAYPNHVYEENEDGFPYAINGEDTLNGSAKDHVLYLLYGNWKKPDLSASDIADINPVPDAKELSIQSILIRIQSGNKTADQIASMIDRNALKELLNTKP